MKQDPPADYKCRDKFLVQAVPITGDKEFISVQEIWDRVEKSDVQERKIRVSFLAADDPDAAPAVTPARQIATNGVDATPDVPPPAYVSPREEPRVNGVLSPEAAYADRKPLIKEVASPSPATPQAPSPARAAPAAAIAPATAPVAAITTTTTNDKDATIAALTAKLAEAEALISSLRKDGGLRQRKGAASGADVSEKAADSDSTPAAPAAQLQQEVRQGTEGVPLQVTAILVLLSFLLAYFFF
ncbi:phosphatidylinositol-binding protein scs2 [Sporothrix eucalyptigena]|uniref:Phosphatidylinositol-binding protein scs2 n=1 Tax=Sporothrix eucalyptigena TaxID=1812306 RepID=A0ABP0AQ51_9PEZI